MAKKSPDVKPFRIHYTKEAYEYVMKYRRKCSLMDAVRFVLGMQEGLVTEKGVRSLAKSIDKDPLIPSLYLIRKATIYIASKSFKIYRNPYGHYVDAEKKIKCFIEKKFDSIKKNIEDDTIRIKLCGDGYCKDRKSFFNFCFTLPDEGPIAKTSRGNYVLGIFRIEKEDHTNLSLCLQSNFI